MWICYEEKENCFHNGFFFENDRSWKGWIFFSLHNTNGHMSKTRKKSSVEEWLASMSDHRVNAIIFCLHIVCQMVRFLFHSLFLCFSLCVSRIGVGAVIHSDTLWNIVLLLPLDKHYQAPVKFNSNKWWLQCFCNIVTEAVMVRSRLNTLSSFKTFNAIDTNRFWHMWTWKNVVGLTKTREKL